MKKTRSRKSRDTVPLSTHQSIWVNNRSTANFLRWAFFQANSLVFVTVMHLLEHIEQWPCSVPYPQVMSLVLSRTFKAKPATCSQRGDSVNGLWVILCFLHFKADFKSQSGTVHSWRLQSYIADFIAPSQTPILSQPPPPPPFILYSYHVREAR
jgi:hypothetical protein